MTKKTPKFNKWLLNPCRRFSPRLLEANAEKSKIESQKKAEGNPSIIKPSTVNPSLAIKLPDLEKIIQSKSQIQQGSVTNTNNLANVPKDVNNNETEEDGVFNLSIHVYLH